MKGYAGITPTVDAIGKIGLTGNIIPRTWSQWLTYDNGKPNPVAMLILAELCYWYRPIEEVDDVTGKVIGWRKKFKTDLLQKSYQDLADCLGFTKRQVSANIHWLQDKGVLKIVSRDFSFSSNVIFIDLFADKIEQISFSLPLSKNDLSENRSNIETLDDVTLECETYTEITTPDTSNHEIKQKHKQADRSHSSDQVCELETLIQEEERQIDSDSEAQILKDVPREEIKQPSNDAELNPGIETKKSRSKTNQEKTQSGKKDKQNPPTPLSRRAAKNEVVPASVRIQPKKAETIALRINDLGWLQLPRNKRYTLARGIAVRRLQHQLAIMFEDVDFLRYEDGTIASEGNRTAMTWDDGKQLEGDRECFSRSGAFDLTSIRDQLFVKGMLGQGVFNDLLEAIFADSVKWCEGQSANAQFVLEKTPIAHLFADDDLHLARSIKEKYEVEI